MSAEDEVRKASSQFYSALNQMTNGNAQALSDIWSHSSSVTTQHPIGGRQVGWDEVQQAWQQVAGVASDGKVELKNQFINASGDTAYETGIEDASFKIAGEKVGGQIRVTNIYRKENGNWKIIHHHTDVAPPMVEVLKKLQGS